MMSAHRPAPETPPLRLIEPPRAFWIAQGMARRAGVALAGAVRQGSLTRRELSAMVAQCQTCAFAEACQSLLADPRMADPPAFCAIGPAILVLGGGRHRPPTPRT